MTRLVLVLASSACLGSVLMAGSFFAFSTFVMRGLARLPAAEGIRAMQAINVAVVPSLFLAVFMGTALIALALLGLAFADDRSRMPLVVGSLAYLVAVFGVTAACNVPRNDALALLVPESVDAAQHWSRYLVEWTAWNHVRVVGSLVAAAAFALRVFGAGRSPT